MLIHLDLETRSRCDLRKAGAWRYAEDPSTDVICLAYKFEDDPEVYLWTPVDWVDGDDRGSEWAPRNKNDWRLFTEVEAGALLYAHNATFERAIWSNILALRHGWPVVADSQWRCTMAVAARKALPLSLDELGGTLNLDTRKDKRGKALIRKFCQPDRKTGGFITEGIGELFEYCRQDVRTEVAVHDRLGDLSASELAVWQHNEKINDRGLPLDMDLVADMQAVVDAANKLYLVEFQAITGLALSGGPKFLAWVNERTEGFGFPDMRAETVATALAEWTLTEEVRRALILRKKLTSASVKKLSAMRACVGFGDRVRGTLQYHGATTGRVAGRLLQPTNFPRGNVELGRDEAGSPVSKPAVLVPLLQSRNVELIEAVAGCPIEAVSASLRNIIRARPGHLIVAADYSTIEARIVLCAAEQWDKVAVLAAGKDIYCDMASAIFRRPIDKKQDPEARHIGKCATLGLGFQMGAKTFQARYAAKQPIEFSEDVVRVYREDWAPKVPELWSGLQRAAHDAMWTGRPCEAAGVEYRREDPWLTARLPSGRKLFYHGAVPAMVTPPWDDAEPRRGWTYRAKKLGQWRTIAAFGGHLAENLAQALSRDLTVAACLRAEAEGFPVIMQVYDEIICEVPMAYADHRVLSSIMLDIPDWARAMRIPVASEGFQTERYRK